jgi:hypothetical protein
MGAAAAIIIRKERDIVRIYQEAGATAPTKARAPSDLGVHHRVAFNILVRRAVLREVGPDCYYLDEPSWNALRSMRRRVASAVALVLLVVFALLVGAGVIDVGLGIPRLH